MRKTWYKLIVTLSTQKKQLQRKVRAKHAHHLFLIISCYIIIKETNEGCLNVFNRADTACSIGRSP